MRPTRLWLTAFSSILVVSALARAQTSYPMVGRVEPTAIRRGQTVELTVSGDGDFTGASALLLGGTGLTAEAVPTPKQEKPEPAGKATRRGRPGGSARFKLSASTDAEAGIREIRVATPQGISSIGLVAVVDAPVVAEVDDKANGAAKGAQKVELPVVVSGKIGAVEDVDWYAVDAMAGQTVVFSLWGNRLEDKIHDLQAHLDPILILHDTAGREIGADDNHDFADPLLIHMFQEKGTYYLEVRDSNYGGNANWTYVLHATTSPFVTSAFPMAVNPGKTAELRGDGANFDRSKPLTLDVPADATPGPRWFPLSTDRGRSQPFPVVVTPLPVVREADDVGEVPAKERVVTLPAAICGRLARKNETDTYRFEAKEGQVYGFEVVARRAGSAADPVLRLLDAKGNVSTEIDDSPGFGKDSRLEWTATADGTFSVQLGDLHSRGGPEFGYVLLADLAKPDFVATCDPDKVNIGPGARTAVFVKVTRRAGFTGPISAGFEGLPEGVTASPLTIPPNLTQGVVVVSAAEDACPASAFLTMHARSGPTPELSRPVVPLQEIYLPGGGRGLYPVSTLAMAVTKPSDITVEVKQAEVVLKPGESTTLDVVVTRGAGYDKPVSLAVDIAHLGRVYADPLPPGVTLKDRGSKTLLGPKETAGKIVLQAAADAPPCERVPIAVLGHVSINFMVKTAYSSAPIRITIPAKAKPLARRTGR